MPAKTNIGKIISEKSASLALLQYKKTAGKTAVKKTASNGIPHFFIFCFIDTLFFTCFLQNFRLSFGSFCVRCFVMNHLFSNRQLFKICTQYQIQKAANSIDTAFSRIFLEILARIIEGVEDGYCVFRDRFPAHSVLRDPTLS